MFWNPILEAIATINAVAVCDDAIVRRWIVCLIKKVVLIFDRWKSVCLQRLEAQEENSGYTSYFPSHRQNNQRGKLQPPIVGSKMGKSNLNSWWALPHHPRLLGRRVCVPEKSSALVSAVLRSHPFFPGLHAFDRPRLSPFSSFWDFRTLRYLAARMTFLNYTTLNTSLLDACSWQGSRAKTSGA